MTPGELLVRVTIWPAIGLGLAACLGWREWLLWRLGLAFHLAHAWAAFHFVHRWSHEAAWQETARQVQALTGWESGAGIWVNYAFTLAWVGVAIGGARLAPRWVRIWRGVFLFLAFQGAVVFTHGIARGLGVLLFGLTGVLAVWRPERGRSPSTGPG